MGTNYYVRYNICKKCNRYDELHLGKSSIGWVFGFRGHENIESFREWEKFIKDNNCLIYDEYGRKHHWNDFLKLVDRKSGGSKHTLDKYHREDIDGYSFTDIEFC
jgi:hypothetical protein